MLNEAQKQKALAVWNYYQSSQESVVAEENVDKQRNEALPYAKECIAKYLADDMTIEDFKTEIDGFNKKNSLWGFKGINGQMFFNMLYNASSGAGMVDNLNKALKTVILVPQNITEAKQKITVLTNFSNSLSTYVSEKRSAPRTGSALFFISYFWQVQDPVSWPIYYKSMVDVFQDLGLWSPTNDYPRDYEEFYLINGELQPIFHTETQQSISLWAIEHAFWVWGEKTEEVTEKLVPDKQDEKFLRAELPTSFIPPVVSILPLLAIRDEEIEQLCIKSGRSIEKAFEEKISILFKMLSYKVETLGQGHGRVPDGIAICSEYYYAIIFDAKVRKEGYSLGTDDRAIKEYIFHETERLKRQGIKNVYFAIICSYFRGDFDVIIRNMKMETEIRELLFIEVSGLLTILEQKLRNPDLDLGPKGIQNLFAQSGILENKDIKEFLGI
jgi:hypothetical protein